MKFIKIIISLLLGSFLFVSCMENIDFKGKITEPMVVVHSFITTDTTITARVSLSRFFLDDTRFDNIDDAEVSVFINGTLKEKMNRIASGQYRSTYKPSIDDTVRLIVKVPSMKEVSSSPVGFCKPPVVNSVDTTMIMNVKPAFYQINDRGDTVYSTTNFKINYTLRFTDNVNEKNYYRLVVHIRSHKYIPISPGFDYWTDEIINDFYADNFSGYVESVDDKIDSPFTAADKNSTNPYRIFSDDLFNGRTCSLTFSSSVYDLFRRIDPSYKYASNRIEKVEISVYLQAITKEYFFYLQTRTASQVDDFLSEPVQVYNNISGGIGFLGSYTSSNVMKFEIGSVPEFMQIVSTIEN